MNETLHIQYDGNSLTAHEEACYESRGKSTKALLMQSFDRLDPNTRSRMKPFSGFFYLGDKSYYPFSYSSSSRNDRTIPCFVFDSWKECGIVDYEDVCEQMLVRGKVEPTNDCLFWIGNTNTHISRKTLVALSRSNPSMCCWDSGDWKGIDGEMKQVDKKYISLPDHTEYKFLIDLQGNGYSARTKILLHSNRPLFYQDRKWHEYWFFDLEPFVHYIPVREDLSDLESKLDWAIKNPEDCRSIAENALIFAKDNLRKENAIKRFQSVLCVLGGIDGA